MLRAWIATAAMLMCLVTSISVVAQQSANSAIHRPTVFAPDDENRGFRDSRPPSDPVLDALLNSKEAKEAGEYLDPLNRESKRKRFKVVRIDLGSAYEEDYIAIGDGPMLTGADNYWFWIVQVKHEKGTVLLFTGGLTVELLTHKTNGHRDIKQFWASSAFETVERYQYIGSVYKLVSKRTHARQP